MSDPRLHNAMQLRRAGRLADAARIYDEVLASEPRHFEALEALAILRYQSGQIDVAERLLALALEVNPSAHEAHYNRACLLQKLGRAAAALASFDHALSLKPDYLEALVNRAGVLAALRRNDEALAALDKVISINANIPEVWNNRGGALIALRRQDEALESYQRALALRPAYADAWKNSAALLMAAGRLDQALQCFDKLLQLDPANSEALRKSADLLLILKHHRDAAERYRAYLGRRHDDAEGWTNYGIALVETERYADALAAFDKAAAASPGSADAWNYRGNVLFQLKRYDEAASSYERAIALAPDLPYAEGYRAQSRVRSCDWSQFEEDRTRIAAGLQARRPVIDPFGNLMLSPLPEDQLRCARIAVTESAGGRPAPLWQGERYRHDRIRVAYLSADFRPHPVAFLIAGVFEHHDKARFQTFGISFGPSSDSDMRRRIAGAFDGFVDVRNRTDGEVAGLLREKEIDIAIDLTGFCEFGRTEILAFRPAPVQVNYLGFPGTLGADFVDYIIADETIIPESHARYFSEKIVYLPDTYQPNDRKRRVASRKPTRTEAGLPEAGTVLCAFNNAYKITPPIFDIWMSLLNEVDGSVLWLLGDNEAAVRNLRREAEARGVGPTRLIFAPRVSPEDHLARFSLADLFLDTLPYNAHTTASDALWMGVPVLTCMGEAFAARVAASLIKAADLPELVTNSLPQYKALALELARDRRALMRLKERLSLARLTCPLFDTARTTRHLETAYEQMWRRWQQGDAPAGFRIRGEA